jgi:cell wall-associated NlpC family hydrolase
MTLTRRAIATVGCLLAASMLAGCGEATVGTAGSTTKAAAKTDPPGATITDAVATSPGKSGTPGVAKEVADPLEADSYPATGSVHHSTAKAPVKAGEAIVAAGAPSDAEVRKELQQMQAVERSARRSQARTLTPVPGGESIGGNGAIPIPSGVPEVIQKVIAGANEIADFPYVYGGGHASFIDNAYDCSGSVSYALAAGGLLSTPETSGQLESWGAPGPGKYITVYANAGHTYMYVDGMLYDTAGRSGVYASRWQVQPTDNEGYVVRHWPGL